MVRLDAVDFLPGDAGGVAEERGDLDAPVVGGVDFEVGLLADDGS